MTFIIFVLLLVYILVVYPLLLTLLRGRGSPRPADPPRWPLVTVVMPVRNGEKWLAAKLQSLLSLDYDHDKLHIVVISDGSTDGTDAIAASFGPPVDLVRVPAGGKAAGLNAGIEHARGDVLFFTDVRQLLAPDSLKHLIRHLSDPSVGVATGELIIRSGDTHEEENVRLYWKLEKWIRKNHSRIDSVLGATGAIYVIRRDLAVHVPPGTLLDDMYLPLTAFLRGYRLVFVEQARAYDFPAKLEQEFHRKVRTLAGVYQLLWLLPCLMGPQNRMWIHFVSHKLGRLALPYLLAGVFISAFWLPDPLRSVILAGQVLFYTTAVIDPLLPPSPLKRFTSIVRTFVVLVWAAFCATAILFRPTQSFWRPTR